MYSFEGEFKRKPVQALGGVGRKDKREEVVFKAQEARRKREAERLKLNSAIRIQSYFRGSKIREKTKEEERICFDRAAKDLMKQNASIDSKVISSLCRQLIYFFNSSLDGQRLTWFSQTFVKHQSRLVQYVHSTDQLGLYQVKHVLRLCCRYLEYLCDNSGQLAAPLRMLEVFTRVSTYQKNCPPDKASSIVWQIITSLVSNGYYHTLRVILESKVPGSIERTVTKPTSMANTVHDMVRMPFSVMSMANVSERDKVLKALCIEFFNQPYSEQVKEFLLPALAYGQQPFPFIELLHALLPQKPVNKRGPGSSTEKGDSEDLIFQWCSEVKPTTWLMYAVLMFGEKHLDNMDRKSLHMYLIALHHLVPSLELMKDGGSTGADDSDDENDDMDVEYSALQGSIQEIESRCISSLNEPLHVRAILRAAQQRPVPSVMTAICTVCHAVMMHHRLAVNKSRLLYTLAFHPNFLKNLWQVCVTASTKTVTGSHAALIQMLSRGLDLSAGDVSRIVPLLSVFCALFTYCLLSLHDSEFYAEFTNPEKSSMPFSIDELVGLILSLRDTCLGVIELAHPETRPEVKEEYKKAFKSVGVKSSSLSPQELNRQRLTWEILFKIMSQLVKQLYSRDSRRPFCPPGTWLSNLANIEADQKSNFYRNSDLFVRRRFGDLGALNPDRTFSIEDGPPLSTKEVRKLTILQELPFVVSFQERVKIFHRLVQQDRHETQGEMRHLSGGPSINITIRRNFLYEDAFEKLSVENEPNLKLKMQVHLMNFAGVDEAGIDGGGLFREFIWELLKTSFDPNRGFFQYTSDNMLYPNAHAKRLFDNSANHYFFLGRILGKAIYENMLVELPFASFFLSKLLSRHRGDVDIHHLASLDPEMYKHLLSLKNYEGDVKNLALDFTVSINELGERGEEELKPGGKQISLDNSNKIEYIHLKADYMLNKRIREQCSAFRNGLADVLNIEWLRMFNHNELQVLISGAPVPIDIHDLKRNTNYSGGYNAEHPCIKMFWEVIEDFSEEQKRQLLKFVTSCSRSPLLGFKDLFPVFCIHYAGDDEERLPTASTCMNLLKLPKFQDYSTMRDKLLYAVESGAGFELS